MTRTCDFAHSPPLAARDAAATMIDFSRAQRWICPLGTLRETDKQARLDVRAGLPLRSVRFSRFRRTAALRILAARAPHSLWTE
jgi:hypothetical protein